MKLNTILLIVTALLVAGLYVKSGDSWRSSFRAMLPTAVIIP